MKAEFDEYGVVHIKPENSAEAYALRAWSEKHVTKPQYSMDQMRDVQYIDTSRLIIHHEVEKP